MPAGAMFQNIKSSLLAAAASSPTPSPSTSPAVGHGDGDLDKTTKEQLLAECRNAQSQLARYKQRLADVVQAYKALQKEKLALEASRRASGEACLACTSMKVYRLRPDHIQFAHVSLAIPVL